MTITHLNPDTLHKGSAFSQVAIVEGPVKMIYVGGQNAVNINGEIIDGGLAVQTEQAMKNVLAALEAAGATQDDVMKLTVYVVQGQPLQDAFSTAQRVWGTHSTTITVLVVVGLANPRFLIEIDAIAAVKA
jgi:2-iminobutanoate/2-iminopropanoate deaminase